MDTNAPGFSIEYMEIRGKASSHHIVITALAPSGYNNLNKYIWTPRANILLYRILSVISSDELLTKIQKSYNEKRFLKTFLGGNTSFELIFLSLSLNNRIPGACTGLLKLIQMVSAPGISNVLEIINAFAITVA